MKSYVLVNPLERDIHEPREWGRLIREAAQERVETPSLLEVS